MRTIKHIVGIEKKWDKSGKEYWITHAILDDGEEARGFGPDFEEGDKVQVFYEPVFDQIKMQKSKKKIDK